MLREYIEAHRWIFGASAAVGMMLIAVLYWRWNTRPNDVTRSLTLAWYTADDGKTWYSDDKSLTPPFDRDGKTSVRAFVFTCDEDKHEFVGYLERYTPEAKQAIENSLTAVKTEKEPPPAGLFDTLAKTGIEVKRPGDSTWINVSSPKAASIRKVACPAGQTLQPVYP
jgi:hypothetical protein